MLTSQLNWRAIGRGMAVALGIAVPVIVTGALVDFDPDSNVVFALFAVLVAGWVLGGWAAGRLQRDAPLTHGALAALAAYLVLAVVTTVVRVAADKAVDPVGLLFYAFMATSAGILGGLVAGRRAGRTAPPG